MGLPELQPPPARASCRLQPCLGAPRSCKRQSRVTTNPARLLVPAFAAKHATGSAAVPGRRTRRTCSRPARRKPPAACPRSRERSPSRSTCRVDNASHTSPCMRLCECVCQCCKGAYSRARPHTTACEGARRCSKPRSCVVSPFAGLPNALMLLLFVTTTASGSSSCCRPSCKRAPNDPAMQCGGQRAAADWHVTSGTLAGLTSADK